MAAEEPSRDLLASWLADKCMARAMGELPAAMEAELRRVGDLMGRDLFRPPCGIEVHFVLGLAREMSPGYTAPQPTPRTWQQLAEVARVAIVSAPGHTAAPRGRWLDARGQGYFCWYNYLR